jgi:hypothetical protein
VMMGGWHIWNSLSEIARAIFNLSSSVLVLHVSTMKQRPELTMSFHASSGWRDFLLLSRASSSGRWMAERPALARRTAIVTPCAYIRTCTIFCETESDQSMIRPGIAGFTLTRYTAVTGKNQPARYRHGCHPAHANNAKAILFGPVKGPTLEAECLQTGFLFFLLLP